MCSFDSNMANYVTESYRLVFCWTVKTISINRGYVPTRPSTHQYSTTNRERKAITRERCAYGFARIP